MGASHPEVLSDRSDSGPIERLDDGSLKSGRALRR